MYTGHKTPENKATKRKWKMKYSLNHGDIYGIFLSDRARQCSVGSFIPALSRGGEPERRNLPWPAAPLCQISFGPRWSTRTGTFLKQAVASDRSFPPFFCWQGIINHSCRHFLLCAVDYASHLYVHYQSRLISCKEEHESCQNVIFNNYSSLMLL